MADTVLALVAHPDDESLWMGSTLAKFALEGFRVVVASATDGLCHRAVDRSGQFVAACRTLGVAEWASDIAFPDQQADMVPQLIINNWAEMYVTRWTPGLVLTHFHGDLNIDHRRVAEAAIVATREHSVVWMCTPEYPERSLGAWAPTKGLSEDAVALQKKWQACQCYPEELAAKPKTRSRERLLRPELFMEVR